MKTIVITGGSRGIGKCLAENFAKDGYNVVLNYNKSEEQAKKIKEDLTKNGYNIEIFRADVSKKAEVKKLIEFAINISNDNLSVVFFFLFIFFVNRCLFCLYLLFFCVVSRGEVIVHIAGV